MTDKQGMTGRIRRADLLLIGGLVMAGIIIGLILLFTGRTGKTVQVRVSGQVVKSFPLDSEAEYEIEGQGGGKNLLIIRNHCAWVEEADCPDKLCKNMGKISMTGQSVVCLPHEVVVEIVDEKASQSSSEETDVDVIAE